MNNDVINHYDLLIYEGNDPVLDPPELQVYMDKWDGQFFIDLLAVDKTKRVLEIGCGTGRLAIKVAPLVRTFCGVDISPKTIETAKKHLSFENVNLICDDFLQHKFDTKFDVVYSSLTFLHIQNKEKAIQIVAELLGEKGRFVLSIDKDRKDRLDYGKRSLKVYPDTPQSIIGLLKESNFNSIEKYETEFAYIIVAKS